MNSSKFQIFFGLATLAVFICISPCYGETAEDLFSRFEKGDLFPLQAKDGVMVISGWEMESDDGKTYHRAVLKRQAEELVKLGRSAAPMALKRLNHSHKHIRYIAAETLRDISKLDPMWYNFGTPGEDNETWSREATKVWTEWFEASAK